MHKTLGDQNNSRLTGPSIAIDSLLFQVVIAPANNLAAGTTDFRLPHADCPAFAGWWTLEGVATPLFQSSIGNQQSAMKTGT
jgi:hypothetical protein